MLFKATSLNISYAFFYIIYIKIYLHMLNTIRFHTSTKLTDSLNYFDGRKNKI